MTITSPMPLSPSDPAITDLLEALRLGNTENESVLNKLLPLVYADLAAIAHRQLKLEAPGHTLNTTDLVHEAYLKLSRQTRAQWVDRSQFFAIAAQIMRRVLVSYARNHYAAKRGGRGKRRLAVDDLPSSQLPTELSIERSESLLDLDEALTRLAILDKRQALVVECRFFGGLSERETAQALGVTERTIARDWTKARGWLYQELQQRNDELES